MKKIILTILLLAFCVSISGAGITDKLKAVIAAKNAAAGPAGLCGGGELFCADFETSDMITWDTTPATEDCDGYDADGDWCDYDTNAPNPKNGSYGAGIRGPTTSKLVVDLTSTSSEFYVHGWWQATLVDKSNPWLTIRDAGDTVTVCDLRMNTTGTGEFHVVTNNGGHDHDTNTEFAINTWYHFGVYYKEGATGTGDGTVRVWYNTDGSTFDAGDCILSTTTADTGTADAGEIQLRGADAGDKSYFDDIEVVSGDPGWAIP